jgi:hypothetical protein
MLAQRGFMTSFRNNNFRLVILAISVVMLMPITFISDAMADVLKNNNPINRNEGERGALKVEEMNIVADIPITLSDNETQITVKKLGSVYNGITGTPLIKIANQEIEAISTAIFANKEYIFNISKPYNCVLHSEMHGDVGINFVDSCQYKVTTIKEALPTIMPGNLRGELTFPIEGPYYYYQNWRIRPLLSIRGTDGHFVKIRITGSLGGCSNGCISFQYDVITNFGIKKVDCRYNKTQGYVPRFDWENGDTYEIIIGPELIRFHILPISTSDLVSLQVEVIPLVPDQKPKEAIIIRYDD